MKGKEVILRINDYTTLNNGVSTEEGNKVNEYIKAALSQYDLVYLDFSGVEILTTAFLNGAIGSLYKNFTGEELSLRLKLKNVQNDDMLRFKMVTDRAKTFYKDQESFNSVVENILSDGNSK